MKSLQSKFNFEFEMIDEKSGGRGNRAGVGYCLSIVRVDPSSSIDTSVYNYLSQSFKQLAMDKRPLVEPLSVMNLIIDKGKEEDFLDRIRRLKPTDSPLHKARKIAKLLLNEYGIQVYADLNPTLGVKNEGESHTEWWITTPKVGFNSPKTGFEKRITDRLSKQYAATTYIIYINNK